MDDRAFGYDGGASPMLLDHASVVRGTQMMVRLPPLDVQNPPLEPRGPGRSGVPVLWNR